MTAGQYIEASDLANPGRKETEDFLKSKGLLKPTEKLKDTKDTHYLISHFLVMCLVLLRAK